MQRGLCYCILFYKSVAGPQNKKEEVAAMPAAESSHIVKRKPNNGRSRVTTCKESAHLQATRAGAKKRS